MTVTGPPGFSVLLCLQTAEPTPREEATLHVACSEAQTGTCRAPIEMPWRQRGLHIFGSEEEVAVSIKM